eukprot:GHVP01037762.1.p1 GENE.GHVP01037762.1~~GHVP01037762.1.p1  ORF type:complete len:209 (+),score=19.95 GHVP01037762.1:79-705(+)
MFQTNLQMPTKGLIREKTDKGLVCTIDGKSGKLYHGDFVAWSTSGISKVQDVLKPLLDPNLSLSRPHFSFKVHSDRKGISWYSGPVYPNDMECRLLLRPEDNVCLVYPKEEELNLTDNAASGNLLKSESHPLTCGNHAITEDRYSLTIGGLKTEVIHFFVEVSKSNFVFRRDREYPNVFYKIKASALDLDELNEIKQSQSYPPLAVTS